MEFDLNSRRWTLMETQDYTVELEYSTDFAIVHLPRVEKFSKDTVLDIKYRLEDLHRFMTTVGYDRIWCAVPEGDQKINRFCKLVGWNYMGNADGLNVYDYEGEE